MNFLSWEINQRNDNVAHFQKVVNKITHDEHNLIIYFLSYFV